MTDEKGQTHESTLEAQSRRWLTFIVIVIAVLGVVSLGIVTLAIKSSGTADTLFERVKYVSATILPLLASWVGTILAFYFSKENLAAATQSVTELSKSLSGTEKLKVIAVRSKMRPLGATTYEQISPGTEATVLLSDLLRKYSNLERIIILDTDGKVRLLIYKSMIERYLSKVATKAVTPASGSAIERLTLKDLLEWSPETLQTFTRTFGFVSADATLADVKQVMDKIDKCGDVFVTASGKSTEPMVGWITDNVIVANATV